MWTSEFTEQVSRALKEADSVLLHGWEDKLYHELEKAHDLLGQLLVDLVEEQKARVEAEDEEEANRFACERADN